MKNCKYCDREFEPKNPKGKFCSDKCRVYFSRKPKEPEKKAFDGAIGGLMVPKGTVTKPEKIHIPLVANPEKKEIPPMPTRLPGEDPFDFAARKNKWKKTYGI